MLKVCEIFKSIQGESTWTGFPCTFIRLSGCNLNCSYCDTEYAKTNGSLIAIDEIISKVSSLNCKLVEITGGEPLIHKKLPILCKKLIEDNHTVLVETNGSQDISVLPSDCIKIVDIKTPGSNEGTSFLFKNIDNLTPRDEIKFVICDKNDYIWTVNLIKKYNLTKKVTITLSPCADKVAPSDLADWILKDSLQLRLGLQLHNILWPNGEPK